MRRHLCLGLVVHPFGHFAGSWRSPESDLTQLLDLSHYSAIAVEAEAAKVDFLFIADTPAATSESPEAASEFRCRNPGFEPITLWSALAARTSRIGLIASASTTYEDPYLLARRFASLDWLSNGRAGWNAVTTSADVSGNLGRDVHPPHSERYDRAHEFIDLVKNLWDSYEADTFLYDQESGVCMQPKKVHKVNHHGQYFHVQGPLNVLRPPQGHPVFGQAGASEEGRRLAAEHAEVVFASVLSMEAALAYSNDLRSRSTAFGRSKAPILLPGFIPILAESSSAAREKFEYYQSLTHPSIIRSYLETYYDRALLDCHDLDEAAPLPSQAINIHGSRAAMITAYVRENRPTLRQVYRLINNGRGHFVAVGTADEVTDLIESWFLAGAVDGFCLMPAIQRAGFREFAESVIPRLQDRGLFRQDYEGTTLRDHLGLEVPRNRWS
jgi:N-acetyl-S-(2-succino)cysteine monooxygenase